MRNRTLNIPAWLTARPIAHRGLHDRAARRIENSASAARAAMQRNYAIECDVQLSADGEAMVFHDFTLDRLTGSQGFLCERTARALSETRLTDSSDGILTLTDFLGLIAGAVPLIIEIKSRFDGDLALAKRVAAIVAQQSAPIAVKSFDPILISFLRANASRLGIAHTPLGIVAEARYEQGEWTKLPVAIRQNLEKFLHFSQSQPDFLSWSVHDLPDIAPNLCRAALGMPVMTWTVRTDSQRLRAAEWADQIVFEGFTP